MIFSDSKKFSLEEVKLKLIKLNIRSDELKYRKITTEDMDILYTSSEAQKWLIPFYLKREANYADKYGYYLVEDNLQKWKVFHFPFNHEHKDMADWFIYLDIDGNMSVIQERFSRSGSNDSELKVLFCSKKILNEIGNICAILFYYGFLFEEMSPDEYWNGYANPFLKYSFATDKGRYV